MSTNWALWVKYHITYELQNKSKIPIQLSIEVLFNHQSRKVSSSYHLCVECFSQLSFDSEVYTKSAAVADFVYTNESCEKHSTQR